MHGQQLTRCFHDRAEVNCVYQRGLVLGTVRGAFSGSSCLIGVFSPPFSLPPPSFNSSFLPPELGLQGRYLSHQPFPPVVGSGCKGRKTWLCQVQSTKCNNGSFPLDISILSVVLFCLSTFSIPWNDSECHSL